MNKKSDIKFVFFGTGDFASIVLDYLHKNNFCPALIVTTPNKPKGRKMELIPNPVKEWANKNSKVIVQPDNLNEIRDLLVGAYDVFVIADYGKIMPKHILNIPNKGCLNIHPSLLPKFRGSSPIQSFILSEEEETGTTIIYMDEQIDHGPIVAQTHLDIKCPSEYLMSYKELEKKLAELGAQLLINTLPEWINDKIKTKEQNHNQATFTKKIKKEDGLINLNDYPEKNMKKILAFTPWPGAYFFIKKSDEPFRIIVTEAELNEGKLIIKKIKPEGKNEMPLNDFFRGNPDLKNQFNK